MFGIALNEGLFHVQTNTTKCTGNELESVCLRNYAPGGSLMGIHGEGTVGYDKGKGCYYARVPVGKLPNGKTRYVRRTARSKTEAQKIRRQLLNDRDNAPLVVQRDVTFRAFATQHLDGEARQEIREVTRRGYLYLLEKFAYPRFGEMALSDIKSTELSAFFLELRKTRSASLVNQLRGAMSRVMTSALNHQMIADNPVQRTRRLRRLEGDTTLSQRPWTLDECKQAMSVSIGTEMDLFIHLAVLTGARLGEMLGLRWGDIDFEENTLTIQRTLTELRGARSENAVKGVPTFSPPKTPKSVRTLTFGQSLAYSLERHKTAQNALRREAGEAWVKTDQVFTNAIGQAVWVSNFSAKYRKFLRVNGLRHQNPHALRHAFAINALGLGIDLPSISRALGHASLQITLDIYAKESKDLQNRATEGLSAWFEQ